MALVIALYKLSLGDILTFPSYLFTRVIYGLMPIKLDKLTKLCGALSRNSDRGNNQIAKHLQRQKE